MTKKIIIIIIKTASEEMQLFLECRKCLGSF